MSGTSRHGDSADTNQVVACQGGDETALETRPVPVPGEGEMVLDLRVVGFCGTDLFKLDTGAAVSGTVLGHELVGDVAAVGPGVDGFQEGDRVAVPHHVPCGTCALCRRGNETMCETFRENLLEPGGFADKVLVRPRATAMAAHRLPDHLSDEAAVFMEPAACVLRGVNRADIGGDGHGTPHDGGHGPLNDGGHAVVLGAGSMGLLHLLVLKAVDPALAVTVVDPVAERRDLARTLGATAATAPGAETEESIMDASDGLGADAVFDTVGGPATLEAGLGLTRQGGAVVLFAHAPEGQTAGFDLNTVFKYERRILGTYSAALAEQAAIFDLLGRGVLDPTPLVTHRLPLDDFAEGVALVRRQAALKVLFTPSRGAS